MSLLQPTKELPSYCPFVRISWIVGLLLRRFDLEVCGVFGLNYFFGALRNLAIPSWQSLVIRAITFTSTPVSSEFSNVIPSI
jgi:hypothetical protein